MLKKRKVWKIKLNAYYDTYYYKISLKLENKLYKKLKLGEKMKIYFK